MTRSNCPHRSIIFRICVLVTLLAMNSAQAEEQAAVKRGDDLWHSPTLGRNGLACDNCHPNSAATHPHSWPRYQINLSKVGTLREMMNWCITVSMLGKPLPIHSDEMDDMEAYVNYMHRDDAISLAQSEQR